MITTIDKDTPRPIFSQDKLNHFASIQKWAKRTAKDCKKLSHYAAPGIIDSLEQTKIVSIQKMVEKHTGLTFDQYCALSDNGKLKRNQNLTYARHLHRYLLREFTNLSWMQIAKMVYNCDHSSCIVSVGVWKDLMDTNRQIKAQTELIISQLKDRFNYGGV